ncbi:hypothetical protein AMI01nite_20460 [Aneurinibacillus migulanus]|nr:hypothetical protein AMI01nite_20460 [Aneurinibacillus migulanus]
MKFKARQTRATEEQLNAEIHSSISRTFEHPLSGGAFKKNLRDLQIRMRDDERLYSIYIR